MHACNIFAGILWLAIPCFGSNSFELTLVSHEGDSVFLPCSYPLASSLSIVWEVNDVIFTVESLPNQLQRVSSGLFIRDVSLQDVGDYNCYTYSMSNLEQLYSNHLVVIPSESDHSSGTIIIIICTNNAFINNYIWLITYKYVIPYHNYSR